MREISYQQRMKDIKEGLILLFGTPICLIFGRRFKWSARLCDKVGNIWWNDN